MSAADRCLKCGEYRAAIRRERLICWDGYDELGKHRFAPWPDSMTDSLSNLRWVDTEDHIEKEHAAHSGHEYGGAYARAAALAAGDPDWMNATGGKCMDAGSD